MRYWQATLKNGTVVREPEDSLTAGKLWLQIRPDVIGLEMITEHNVYILPKNCPVYEQGKTASAAMCGGEVKIESRWIGFRTKDGQLLKLRFPENGNRIKVELST